MATVIPVLHEDSVSLEGDLDSMYAADDNEELDDIELMVKCHQEESADDKDEKKLKSSMTSNQYQQGGEESMEEDDDPGSPEKEENSYGLVIEGVKSITEDEDFGENSTQSLSLSGSANEQGSVEEREDVYREINYDDPVNDNTEVQGLNFGKMNADPEQNNDLMFDHINIKQEPMDDDDYIQEHDYFGNADFNDGMEKNLATGFGDGTDDLDPSVLVQYQDLFSITENGRYKCKFCCCSVDAFIQLKKHIDRRHQQSYMCKYCGQSFPRSQDVAAHTKNAHREELLIKKHKKLKQMESLLKKKNQSKNIPDKNHDEDFKMFSKMYKCKHCSKKFGKSQSLAVHVQWHHKKETLSKKINRLEGKLNSDPSPAVIKTNPANSSPLYNRTYRCNYCPKVFHKQQVMANHVKHCPTNPKATKTYKKKDQKEINYTPSYEDYFGRESSPVNSLVPSLVKQEESQDNTEKKFIINPKQWKKKRSKTSPKKSERTNIQRVVFQCPECSETFATKKLVKLHLNRSHPSVYCRYCPKAFHKSSKLLFHLFRHLGDIEWRGGKQFFCKLCKLDLPYEKAAVLHVKHHILGKNPQGITLNMEKQILLECEQCGQPFCSTTGLVFHELDHKTAMTEENTEKKVKKYTIKKEVQEKCLTNIIHNPAISTDMYNVTGLANVSDSFRELGIDAMDQQESISNTQKEQTNDSEFIPVSRIPFKCGMCEARFPNSQFLLHHMTLHMKGQYVFKIEVDKNLEEAGKILNQAFPTNTQTKMNSVCKESTKLDETNQNKEELKTSPQMEEKMSTKIDSTDHNNKQELKTSPEMEENRTYFKKSTLPKQFVESKARCRSLINNEIKRLFPTSTPPSQDHSYSSQKAKNLTQKVVKPTQKVIKLMSPDTVIQRHGNDKYETERYATIDVGDENMVKETASKEDKNKVMAAISKAERLVVMHPQVTKRLDYQVSLLKPSIKTKEEKSNPEAPKSSVGSSVITGSGAPVPKQTAVPSSCPTFQLTVVPTTAPVSKTVVLNDGNPTVGSSKESRDSLSENMSLPKTGMDTTSFNQNTSLSKTEMDATSSQTVTQESSQQTEIMTMPQGDINPKSVTSQFTQSSTTEAGESSETGDSDIVNSDLESSSDSECSSNDSDCEISKTYIEGVTRLKSFMGNNVKRSLSKSEIKHETNSSVNGNLTALFKIESIPSPEPSPSHSNYKRQLNIVDGEWLECEQCMYLCRSKAMLDNHLLNHAKNKNKKLFQCPVCGRKVISKWHLSNHMKTHRSNEYECSQCGEYFETSVMIIQHMQLCHV